MVDNERQINIGANISATICHLQQKLEAFLCKKNLNFGKQSSFPDCSTDIIFWRKKICILLTTLMLWVGADKVTTHVHLHLHLSVKESLFQQLAVLLCNNMPATLSLHQSLSPSYGKGSGSTSFYSVCHHDWG